MLNTANWDIRKILFDRHIKQYDLASVLGISASTIGIWMRKPLTEEHRQQILNGIEKLTMTRKE